MHTFGEFCEERFDITLRMSRMDVRQPKRIEMLLAASLLALGSIVFALILTPLTRDFFKKLG